MVDKCENCTEKCPQAERAHQAALGRMYSTKEFVALLKKVESGEMVEVVRCKNCKHGEIDDPDFPNQYYCHEGCGWNDADFYCSYGERKTVKQSEQNPKSKV